MLDEYLIEALSILKAKDSFYSFGHYNGCDSKRFFTMNVFYSKNSFVNRVLYSFFQLQKYDLNISSNKYVAPETIDDLLMFYFKYQERWGNFPSYLNEPIYVKPF